MSELTICGYQVKFIDIIIVIIFIILILLVTKKSEGAKVVKGSNRLSQVGMYDLKNNKKITKEPPKQKTLRTPGFNFNTKIRALSLAR
jgi:hypothetical protein